MNNWLVLALLVLIVSCTSLAGKDIPKGFLSKTIELGGKDIEYVVYVPRIYDASKPIPAIIFLNGKGECGTDGFRQVFHLGGAIMLNVEKWPFIILFPQKQYALEEWEEHPWEDQDDMVMAILKKSEAEYKIDKSRLYLTGLSQGGHGTWAIAAKHPDLFTAIAPICGWGDKTIASKLGKMPIWTFHGDADTTVLPARSQQMVDWVKDAGGTPKFTVYPGVGHNAWDKAYREEDLGAWFLEHRK
ncbi:MAG TPA: prolyl oligopeptidase family serine peptidase [Armatimonadota bacterium]|nr:prolyl oligopeptidase family serine peptidase [Armatimonadota bacterium]